MLYYILNDTHEDTTVAKASNPLEELNVTAKKAAEQTTEQALSAANGYFDFLRKTVSSFPSGGTDLGEHLKSYAEKNIAATQDYIHKLSQAKDFQDVVRIQTEFMQTQFSAFGEQTKILGEAFTNDAAKSPLKNLIASM